MRTRQCLTIDVPVDWFALRLAAAPSKKFNVWSGTNRCLPSNVPGTVDLVPGTVDLVPGTGRYNEHADVPVCM